MRVVVAFVTIMALMAVALMPVDMALGQEVNPERVLPHTVERGQRFNVTVTFTAPADKFNSIGLTDLCPDGWNVTVDETWCTPTADTFTATGNKAEIGWFGEPSVGFDNGTSFTALYKVTVPGDASAGIHTFDGSVEYWLGPEGPYNETVTGDSEVEVVAGKEANPSRILPETVERGQTFNVTVTFTATADNFTAISLIDLAPDDWDVTVDKTWCQPQGSWTKATGNMAELAWQGPYNGGVDFTVLYEVTVPCGAAVGNYIFSGYEGLGYFVGPSGHIFENITGDSEVGVVPPAICSNPSISLYAAVGQDPENETLELWSSTSCMLKWSLTDDAAWLVEYPTSGSCTDVHSPVSLSANASAMPFGNYSASITITAPGASNNPQIVPVTLYVGVSPPSPAQFTVTGLDVTPQQVLPGQPVTVSAQVTNTGGSGGSHTVNLTVNGQVEQTKTVTLAPEAMETVTFTVTKEVPGSYTVSIGGLTKEFTVVAPSWLNRYWWLIVVGVVAVVLLVYFLRRKRGA